jgi:hypothetical protein
MIVVEQQTSLDLQIVLSGQTADEAFFGMRRHISLKRP